jgi:hypothetical protein
MDLPCKLILQDKYSDELNFTTKHIYQQLQSFVVHIPQVIVAQPYSPWLKYRRDLRCDGGVMRKIKQQLNIKQSFKSVSEYENICKNETLTNDSTAPLRHELLT